MSEKIATERGKKYGGILTNYSVHSTYGGHQFVFGIMTGCDPTGRFQDGFTVRTSSIIEINVDRGYVETANTVYTLHQANVNPLPDNIARGVYF